MFYGGRTENYALERNEKKFAKEWNGAGADFTC